jgi:hypothetical protein
MSTGFQSEGLEDTLPVPERVPAGPDDASAASRRSVRRGGDLRRVPLRLPEEEDQEE